jgi:preprotein translocase YajC subunit
MPFLIFPILLVLMYLVLLRPQQQRLRAQRQLVASLDVGDEIVTAGGIIGRIVDLTDERASVEVADGVVIDFLRVAVNRKADASLAGSTGSDGADDDVADADVTGESAGDHLHTDEESR